MEAGIIAAIVILAVELVIIIVVLAFLFSRRHPARKPPPRETGQYTDDPPNGVITKPSELKVKNEKEEVKEKEDPPKKLPIEQSNLKIASDDEDTDSGESKLFRDPVREPAVSTKDLKFTQQEEISPYIASDRNDSDSDRSADPPDIYTKQKDADSSSDEGVGDVEKPSSSARESSSDSSEDETSEKQEKKFVKKEEKKSSTSESSSSSSSESEEENDKKSIQLDPPVVTQPQSVVIMQRDSSANTLNSLENGVTLSLRLDPSSGNFVIAPSSSSSFSSSSSSSSSEDEGDIKVIRSYDKRTTKDSDMEASYIYDPLRQKVVNMDDLRTDVKESSFFGESDNDEPVPVEGDEGVAGIINVTSGEKLTICRAITKGLIPEKTGMLLLEAQAATGSVVNPRTGVKLSVEDAVRQGVVDLKYKSTLAASEGAYYGYLDPRKNESVPLFEAMKRDIFPRAQGMRLLEAQVATGGIVDPWTGKRYNLSGALSKSLIDKNTAKILKNPEDHADFFDPNTKQRFSYGNLLSKCIRDLNTGLKFLYLEEKPLANVTHYQPELLTFRSAFRRKVSLQDLINAGLVSQRLLDQFNRGEITKDGLYEKLKPFLIGEPPIAGIYNRTNHEVLTICQAVRSGLLRRGTALELLEAQAATGNMIDPKTGKQMSVNRAIGVGLVDHHFASALRKAELAVLGYESDKSGAISLFEAMKKGIVIEVHGTRLLDAQIATGGLIDPVGGYRIPVSVAMKRGLLDQRLAETLAHPTLDQKGYYDPNTDENLTYAELLRRTVVGKKKHIGMRLLPLSDKTPNLRIISKGPTRNRKITVMNPKTKQPMSLKQAVDAKVIDVETAKKIQAQQRV